MVGGGSKTYETPSRPHEAIQEETELLEEYGLKNKKELWKAESELRRHRRETRRLLAEQESGEQIVEKLQRFGILEENTELNDILSLDVEDILERRLQTLVYRKGLARSIDQARQFVVHGHISIGDRRVTVPSYTVKRSEEEKIDFHDSSSLSDELHPERAEES